MKMILKVVNLDFYTMKGQMANYLLIPVLALFFSFMGSSMIVLSLTAAWFVLIINTNIFAIQEKNGLDRLYVSLSISQRNMVMGRYIFLFLNFVFAYFVVLIVGVIASIFHSQSIAGKDLAVGFCISCLLFSVVSAMQLPIFFKIGYTKGKYLSLIPFFVVVMSLLIFPTFIDGFSFAFGFAWKHIEVISVLSLVVSIAAGIVSYYISVFCYKKQR